MKYEIWRIVIICLTAFTFILQTVYLILSRRRAQKFGILRVKYPIWDNSTWLSALVVFIGVFVVIVNIADLPHDIAELADHRAMFAQDPELYSRLIETAETAVERDKFQLVWGAAVTVLKSLSIFSRGAYITKDGVVFFAYPKLQMTSARVEDGAIKFYTRTLREAEKDREYRYAFELPENEDNRGLFKGFITTDANA